MSILTALTATLLLYVAAPPTARAGFAEFSCISCPDAWVYYNMSCYHFADTLKKNWADAITYCQGLKADPMAIQTDGENMFVVNYAKRLFRNDADRSGAMFWTGGTDEKVEGQWRWYHNDEMLTYKHWAQDQPNNHHHNEDCLGMQGFDGFEWYDINCADTGHPVCEISASPYATANILG